MMKTKITREIGYYWVHFGSQLRGKGLTSEWLISFWDGECFIVNTDEWSDDCFDAIDEKRLERANGKESFLNGDSSNPSRYKDRATELISELISLVRGSASSALRRELLSINSDGQWVLNKKSVQDGRAIKEQLDSLDLTSLEAVDVPNVLLETSVEVKGPVEYGMTLAAYLIAGANVWPWHKGYKPLDTEECSHHLYGWEECGFLKHAGVGESASGDFKSPLELIDAVKNAKGA